MGEEQLWREYLEIINTMSEFPATYGMDNKRQKLHEKLTNMYGGWFPTMIEGRFDDICHNLDKIIYFEPPIERYDSTRVYAADMVAWMWSFGKLYLTNPQLILENYLAMR